MSEDSPEASRPSLSAGFVWAALLFSVVVIVASVALLLWVTRTTQVTQ